MTDGPDDPALRRLRELAPPPDRRPPASDWASAERELGTALPASFKALADLYGPGRFGGFLGIVTPAALTVSNSLVHLVRRHSRTLAPAGPGEDALPFEVRPGPDGLMPWGKTLSDHVMNPYWWRRGEADGWPTVLLEASPTPRHVVWEGSVTALLVELLEGRLQVPFARERLPLEEGFETYLTEREAAEANEPRRGLLGRLVRRG